MQLLFLRTVLPFSDFPHQERSGIPGSLHKLVKSTCKASQFLKVFFQLKIQILKASPSCAKKVWALRLSPPCIFTTSNKLPQQQIPSPVHHHQVQDDSVSQALTELESIAPRCHSAWLFRWPPTSHPTSCVRLP